MSGAVPLLTPYALMACTVKNFYLSCKVNCSGGRLFICVVGSKNENMFLIVFIFICLIDIDDIFFVFVCVFGDWAKYFMISNIRNVNRNVMLQYCSFYRYYLRYKRIFFFIT